MSGGTDRRGSIGLRLIATAAGGVTAAAAARLRLHGPERASAWRHQDLVPDQPPG